jgi:16S rRNA (guanine966-N2)-methyltransferase
LGSAKIRRPAHVVIPPARRCTASQCVLDPASVGYRSTWHGNDAEARVRIVGGKFAGRDLTSPADFRVRPTAEHVRAAVLEALALDVPNARILDLFAGTGALGLESLSRGAKSADFVEFRPASLHALRANVAALKLRDRTRIFKRDAVQFAAALSADSYEIAFVDPPYESRQLDLVIGAWQSTGFARILVAEHARTHEIPRGGSRRAFEDTVVTIYRT